MLKYGIIGCGMMGQEHIRNIALLPECEITAIFEPNSAMRNIAKQLAPNAKYYETLKDLVSKASIDCLVIATPNYCHIDNLREIGKITQLPILIEKPVVTNFTDIRKLRDFQNKYSAPIWVAMEYRFMPALQKFIKKSYSITGGVKMLSIRENRYPFLKKIDNWNRFNKFSGGTFVEKCCHFFDLMRLINKSNPSQIMASGSQDCNHLDEYYKGEKCDIWDNGYVIIDFENGTRAMLELCMFADVSIYQEEISAVGKKGKIECKLIGPKRFWKDQNIIQPESQIVINNRQTKSILIEHVGVEQKLLEAGDHNGSTYFQHLEFQKVVLGKKPVEVSIEDGIWSVIMGIAAQHSAVERRAIQISEVN